MKKSINIFWFRRDLRLDDNCGLFHALSSNKEVLPIFVFDEDILERLPKDDARVTFIYQEIENIQNQLLKIGSSISVFLGKPLDIFNQLSAKNDIGTVYTNHDYEPYAIKRDNEIKEFLVSKNIDFKTYKDQVIFERNEIVKKDGTPYKVYTPFSKKWLEAFHFNGIQFYPSEENLDNFIKNETHQFLSLEDIRFTESSIKIESYKVNTQLIDNYEETRNFPAKNSTSKLGTHLRFGTVSVRKMVKKASKSDNITFLKELIWREFFMQIIFHFPKVVSNNFRSKYDGIKGRNN
jgi:deoxyribodipyrimidine photo-lyase